MTNLELSCADCRYDNKTRLCTHPDESKPGFWDERPAVEGRPWCWEKDPELGPFGCRCQAFHHRITGDGCEICNPGRYGEDEDDQEN